MNPGRYLQLVAQSLRRNRRHFLLSSIGVVIGIATLFFFTSLGEGVRTTVLQDVFVIDQLEVVDPAAEAGIQTGDGFGAAGLDDDAVDQVRDIEGVQGVYPKMKLTFPSYASGGRPILDRDLRIEFVGDGIPAELVEEDVDDDLGFRDPAATKSCEADRECPDGRDCVDGQCTARSCSPGQVEPICDGASYCHEQRRECALPVPLLVSPYLLEVYHGSLHTALGDAEGLSGGLPRISEQMLIGFEFDLVFGTSYLADGGDDTVSERARIVGLSDQAMQLGATMPLEVVARLNERFSGQAAGDHYHSLLVETDRNEDVAPVVQALETELNLELADRHRQAERAGTLILSLTLLFNLIALIILGVSAITITHTFSMMVMKRRTEIGLMRALGATRRHVQSLIVGEAAVVGFAAGLVGIALGLVGAVGVNALFVTYVPDFPFKPETLFAWSPWMFGLALATAVVFCLLGSYIPARRAGDVEPAQALTGR